MTQYRLENHLDGSGFWSTMAEDVRRGLTSTPKTLLPKYFYDERGSDLFEQITRLPEYYPMRAEAALLETIGAQLMASLQPDEVVELGSGSSTKTRILLDRQDREHPVKRYVGFDVSEAIVREAAQDLLELYPGLEFVGVIGDFERHLDRIPAAVGRRLVLFLGSTIGNLHPQQRLELLRSIGSLLQAGDRLLLGMDLIKDIDVLERAYNDAAGVTAEFNLNVLRVINKELDADFDVEAFRHFAVFNREAARIEMHLQPSTPQVVRVGAIDLTVEISPEETIWTESSHKFSRESAIEMLQASRLGLEAWYTGPEQLFGLALAVRV